MLTLKFAIYFLTAAPFCAYTYLCSLSLSVSVVLQIEFWEDHFKCRYPNSSLTPYNGEYTTPCTTKEQLTKNNTDFEDQLQFVTDAVMTFAYALRWALTFFLAFHALLTLVRSSNRIIYL